jgi:hypothetical protein
MPNHVTNILSIDAEEALLKEIRERVAGGDESEDLLLDFQKIVPMPEELEGTDSPPRPPRQLDDETEDAHEERVKAWVELQADLLRRFGHADWYGWRLEHWGTKWKCYGVDETEIGWRFDTAWSAPVKVVLALSAMFPDAVFTLEWADEDFGVNVGHVWFEAGKVTHDANIECCSQAAYSLAKAVLGYDPREDQEEEEEAEGKTVH